ncbi:hypothetical protein ACX1C1_24665 [Paenibacillus sp. strain BS8-2]
MEPNEITEEEMLSASEEFAYLYPILMNEIEHIERLRGRLNDFQLMLAVSRAKDSMEIVGWERRQTINAILGKYAQIYRTLGREEADEWVMLTFGFRLVRSVPADHLENDGTEHEVTEAEAELNSNVPAGLGSKDEEETMSNEFTKDLTFDLQEIASLIAMKEAELLQLYREFYRLSKG